MDGRAILERASCAACWSLTGLSGVSLCALAWSQRDGLFWGLWVLFWDWVFAGHERAHCRASYARCFK